ncbi:hypothetical protein BC938DRAFT_471677, partial [Jimgerdemannia flammicorona]
MTGSNLTTTSTDTRIDVDAEPPYVPPYTIPTQQNSVISLERQADGDITIGFGVTRLGINKDNKDNKGNAEVEEEYWSVVYMKNDGEGKDCKVIFLRINTKNSFTRLDNAKTIVGRPRDIVGHVRILDDGRTLLILGSERLFMVNMESRSLTHTTGHEFKNSDHASNERDLKTLDDAGTEHELKNPDDATKITRSSSISFVTPLKATIARLFISDLNDLLPSSVIETPPKKTLPKTLEFKEPPAIIPYQGQPKRSLKVVRKDQSQECQVEILGVNKRRAGDEPFQKLKLKYKLNGNRRTETVDTLKLSISPKHASRYIQYAGETYQSRTRQVYVKSLKEVIESSNNKKFLMNEVEPETRTSTLGHVIRDPSTEAVERVRTVLKANAYRPLFYDSELWDASALTEALSVGNFEMVEDIVKYCLQKDISKNNGTLLELGYLAIVIGALPTIARKKPMLAVYIAQYTSHIQLDRFISNFPEIDIDTKKSADGVIARVEELPKDVLSPFVSWVLDPLRPLERWWAKPQKSLDSWWDEQREPHPI